MQHSSNVVLQLICPSHELVSVWPFLVTLGATKLIHLSKFEGDVVADL